MDIRSEFTIMDASSNALLTRQSIDINSNRGLMEISGSVGRDLSIEFE